ncbi:MAG: DoxX family protein [Candidatus Sulfotelmatobacter sp.]
MPTSVEIAPGSKKMLWAGRILSALPVLLVFFTLAFALLNPAAAAQGFAHYGYPSSAMLGIMIAEVASVILYAIPRTAVLGAILLTGYMGGATATHVRVGEPFYIPVIVGIVIWTGLYLRDERLRTLLPLRD